MAEDSKELRSSRQFQLLLREEQISSLLNQIGVTQLKSKSLHQEIVERIIKRVSGIVLQKWSFNGLPPTRSTRSRSSWGRRSKEWQFLYSLERFPAGLVEFLGFYEKLEW